MAGNRQKEDDNPWCERHPGFWVMCCKTVLRNAINRGELPISLKDNRGVQTLAALPDDEARDDSATLDPVMAALPAPEPLTVESPNGFHETVHTEDQAPYSVGDDIAADAEKEVGEQTPAELTPEQEYAQAIREAKTEAAAKAAAQAADEAGFPLPQLLADKLEAMRVNRSGKVRQKEMA